MGLTRRMFAGLLGGMGLLGGLLKNPPPAQATVPEPVKDPLFQPGQRLLVSGEFLPDPDEPLDPMQDGSVGHLAVMVGHTVVHTFPLNFTHDAETGLRLQRTFIMGQVTVPAGRAKQGIAVVLISTASGVLRWQAENYNMPSLMVSREIRY